jgi:hypothetical protein
VSNANLLKGICISVPSNDETRRRVGVQGNFKFPRSIRSQCNCDKSHTSYVKVDLYIQSFLREAMLNSNPQSTRYTRRSKNGLCRVKGQLKLGQVLEFYKGLLSWKGMA